MKKELGMETGGSKAVENKRGELSKIEIKLRRKLSLITSQLGHKDKKFKRGNKNKRGNR